MKNFYNNQELKLIVFTLSNPTLSCFHKEVIRLSNASNLNKLKVCQFTKTAIDNPQNYFQHLRFVFARKLIENLKGKTIKISYNTAKNIISTLHSLDRASFLCDFYYVMKQDDWCKLFINEWTGIETADFIRDEFYQIITNVGINKLQEFMCSEDKKAWNKLDDEIIVYRGCSNGGEKAFSWTLDKEVAEMFFYRKESGFKDKVTSFKMRLLLSTIDTELQKQIREQKPQKVELLKGKVNKKDCIVFFSGKGEAEVFCQNVELIN